MRVKAILSIFAFVAAFALSVLLVGVPQNSFYPKYKRAQDARNARGNILMVLHQDIDNGYLRNQKIRYLNARSKYSQSAFDISSYADATIEYVDASESISLSGLPRDFQAAWLEHMRAWREHSDFLDEQKSEGLEYTASGREIPRYPFNQTDEILYRNQVNRINQTWDEVLRIGRKYGAYVEEY